MTKRRGLVIFGAFGGVNIGDEVILESDLALAKAAGYREPVTVIGTSNSSVYRGKTSGAARATEFIYFKNLSKVLRALWGKDLFIGGGQIIDGSMGPKYAAIQLLFALWARISGGCVRVGGVGVSQIDGVWTRWFYNLLFHLCADVAVRDEASHQALQYSAAYRKIGRCAADVVFSFPIDETSHVNNTRSRIGFAVHAAPHITYMDFDEAKTLLLALIEKYGADNIDIIAHDNRLNFDLDFARRLATSVAGGQIAPRILCFETVEECLTYYQRVKVIVSARMHPLIIGAITSCVCVPLQGSSKVTEFAKLTHLKVSTLSDTNSVIGLIESSQIVDHQTLDNLATKARTCLE